MNPRISYVKIACQAGKLLFEKYSNNGNDTGNDKIISRGGSRISRWGGAPNLIGGGAKLQHRCFLVKTYIKTKEFGPVGARAGNFCM